MNETPVILLVEDNSKHARLVFDAFQRLSLPQPLHISHGETAVSWLGTHACDLCVLDYDLPDIDGLETLIRIHQRKPDLPIIMVSSAQSERIAIDAYEAGITSYIPKKSGFDTTVAQLVQQHIRRLPSRPEGPTVPVAFTAIPDELRRPTLENRLRVVGQHLDLYGYHTINLLEIGTGYLVRALPHGQSRNPEALDFSNDDFPHLVAQGYSMRGNKVPRPPLSPLLPTGYEDFLRALGHRLDFQSAEAVTVTELDSFIAVGGIEGMNGKMQPFQAILREEEISSLLDEAFGRRAKRNLDFRRA